MKISKISYAYTIDKDLVVISPEVDIGAPYILKVLGQKYFYGIDDKEYKLVCRIIRSKFEKSN